MNCYRPFKILKFVRKFQQFITIWSCIIFIFVFVSLTDNDDGDENYVLNKTICWLQCHFSFHSQQFFVISTHFCSICSPFLVIFYDISIISNITTLHIYAPFWTNTLPFLYISQTFLNWFFVGAVQNKCSKNGYRVALKILKFIWISQQFITIWPCIIFIFVRVSLSDNDDDDNI